MKCLLTRKSSLIFKYINLLFIFIALWRNMYHLYHTSTTPFCLGPNYQALLQESLNKWNGFSDINSPLWIHIGTYIKIGLPLTSYWIQLRACVKRVNKILPSAPKRKTQWVNHIKKCIRKIETYGQMVWGNISLLNIILTSINWHIWG